MLSSRRVHPTLPSSDLEALRPFYETVLGFTPLAERPGLILYMAGAGTLFALSRSGVPAAGSHTQMAFTVDDIGSEVAELRARGVVFETYESPMTVDGIASIGPGRAAWFKDPQDNVIAILEFHDPA